MQVREVLEVYHADLPVGRFPLRRLVSVHGPGAGRCQAEPSKRIHLDLLIRLKRVHRRIPQSRFWRGLWLRRVPHNLACSDDNSLRLTARAPLNPMSMARRIVE